MEVVQPLTVPGVLTSLATIRKYVKEATNVAKLDTKVAYGLLLAVEEISENAIIHGYDEAGLKGNVEVQADIAPQTVTISIEDTGQAYDPRRKEAPDNLDLPMEERPIGGLGVYLTLQNVDQFHYERVGDKNRNILIVKRT